MPPATTMRLTRRVAWPDVVSPLALCGLVWAATLSPAAYATMNFCAAPALQTSERINADSSVQVLIKRVQARLSDQPKPVTHLSAADAPLPQALKSPRLEAETDLDLMRDAALVWRATGDGRYLQLVDRFLLAWATTYQPNFSPLSETHLDRLMLAYDLTASALSVKTRNATAALIAQLANGYLARLNTQPDVPPQFLAGAARHRWESHRVKLIAMAAFTLDDRKLIAAAQRLFIEQIERDVEPEGATDDAVDDLKALVIAALSARRHNRNWLSARAQNGASLMQALDKFTPEVLGAQQLAAQSDAAGLYYLAARLLARYASVAQRLSPTPPAWLAVCLPLAARK